LQVDRIEFDIREDVRGVGRKLNAVLAAHEMAQ